MIFFQARPPFPTSIFFRGRLVVALKTFFFHVTKYNILVESLGVGDLVLNVRKSENGENHRRGNICVLTVFFFFFFSLSKKEHLFRSGSQSTLRGMNIVGISVLVQSFLCFYWDVFPFAFLNSESFQTGVL